MTYIENISKKLGKEISKYNDNENAEQIITYIIKIIINNIIWFVSLYFTWFALYLIQGNEINAASNAIIMLIFYMPLRTRFGGSHAKTFKMCLILSTIIPVMLGFVVSNIDITLPYMIAVYIFAYLTAFKIGVVDNAKRRFDRETKEKFKKQGIVLLTIIMIINFIVINNNFLSDSIIVGVFLAFINLYFEKDIWENLKIRRL